MATQALYNIAGISTEEVLVGETGRLLAAFIKGGFKRHKIVDHATVFADQELIDLLAAKDMHITETIRGNGE